MKINTAHRGSSPSTVWQLLPIVKDLESPAIEPTVQPDPPYPVRRSIIDQLVDGHSGWGLCLSR